MLVNLADLHRALAHDEMVPAFQPLVELRTGRLTGFEVLARWQHAELGLILPTNFIPIAEEFGLIPELTDQVFRKAFRACRNLPERLSLAVNVSATQLNDLSLPTEIWRLAEMEGFAMSRLQIEITESALLKDLRRAISIADDLKRMGCRLSLDDFGTGYSSLAHLHALPFDQLKVDRSFVSSVTDTRSSRKIVAAIVGLGNSLGLETVAEGIETEAQADKMLELGCELGQGWLYGRPAPAEKLSQMIDTERYGPSLGVPLMNRAEDEPHCLDAMPGQRLSQLRAIYDGAPVGLCFLDMNLRHVSVNRKLANMNGTSIKAHIGQHIQEVMGSAFSRVEPYLRRAMMGEAIRGVELTLNGDGAGTPRMRMLASYEPALDDEGVVIGVSVAVIALPGQATPGRSTWKAILKGRGWTTSTLLEPIDVGLRVARLPK